MALSLESVDLIWAKLSVAYGHRFLSIWEGMPQETVKVDWAQQLDGIPNEAILWALQHLPSGRAPDVMDFRKICNQRPDPAQKALPHVPRAAPVPDSVRAQIAKLKAPHEEPERVRWARMFVERFGGEGLQLRYLQRRDLEQARRILSLHEADESLTEAKKRAQAAVDHHEGSAA